MNQSLLEPRDQIVKSLQNMNSGFFEKNQGIYFDNNRAVTERIHYETSPE